MTQLDIIALIVVCIGVASFATVITVLYRNYVRSNIQAISNGKRDIELIDEMIYETDIVVKRRRKGWNIAKSVMFYSFLAIAIPLFGLAMWNRISGNIMIGDNAVMVVASGSMSEKHETATYLKQYNLNNQFSKYDIIVLNKVSNSNQLKLYDVISFKNNKGVNIIHRIIGFDGTRYITRGDANPDQDSYMPTFSDVIGKYSNKKIPAVGVFIMFLQSYAGIITVVSVVYTLFMLDYYNKKLANATEEREEILGQVFDVENMGDDDALDMEDGFKQMIYFKNNVYTFDEEGFVGKFEMSPEDYEKLAKLQQKRELEEQEAKKKKHLFGHKNKDEEEDVNE